MDAGAADPLRAARPEEGSEKAKAPEGQDDGYETSNSGEAARRKPSSAEGSPAPPPPLAAPPAPDPPAPAPAPRDQDVEPDMEPDHEPEPYELMQRHYPAYRHFEQPQQQQQQPQPDYQHFPFPKYSSDPYGFKREADAPYDMSHHAHPHQYGHPHQQHKRDEEMYNGVKRECEDPYSFVEEEAMCAMLGAPPHLLHDAHGPHAPHAQHAPHAPHAQHAPHAPHALHGQHPHHHPHQHPHMQMHPQQMMLNQPKKRGRKKKIKDENGMEIKVEGVAEARPVKERKKHDRFNGMSEEEVARRTLPDHLAENLDIIIIGINPGLFAAYKGHHYAGPGNHFWKCLYLSGLTREQMSADEDYKLLNFGIGFTNMVGRATKGSADLTRREIKEGSAALLDKLRAFRPKVAVFNGKLIYEVFSGKKDFCFGKQPDTVAGTNTYMWVMPSSSARCAQLPRAADKVPFYAALKKFRDYLNGLVAHVDEAELVFPDNTSRRPQEEMEIRRLTMEPEPGDTIILEDGTEVPLKKKRGRPKKIKLENGETAPPAPRAPRQPRAPPPLGPDGEQPPKKKRGRPKKVRPEEQQFLLQQQQQQQQQSPMLQQQLPAMAHEGGYLGGAGGGGAAPPAQDMADMMYSDAPYFQHGGNMESPMEVSAPLGLARYSSPGPGAGGATGAGGGGAGGAYPAASPRAVYASPRSQPYSPGPQRRAPTPQPQQFPSSPAAFSAPSPPRNNPYGSPARGVGSVGVGGVGVGGVGVGGGFPGRSPLYAASPAPYAHAQGSPHLRLDDSYDHARDPQSQTPRPYSRSPAPLAGAGAAFPAASPAALHSYTPSPAHTPYSQHSSPAPRTPAAYPSHPSPAPQHPLQQPRHQGSGSTGSNNSQYAGELSSDIGAAISSPASPLALEFEPPRDQRPPSADMHPGSASDESLSDYNKTNSGVGEMSPAGVSSGFGPGLYEQGEGRLPFAPHSMHSPAHKEPYHYREQGNNLGDSPRLDHLQQHPSMYPSNFNRATPEGGGNEGGFSPHAPAFRPPDQPHTPHAVRATGSPGEYSTGKPKSQDVASKSLSGLESLVDQIPSIAEGQAGAGAPGGAGGGEAPAPALPEYPLYPPYGYPSPAYNSGAVSPAPRPAAPPTTVPSLYAYGSPAYGNNGYGAPFVGYGGGWGGQLMRPTPGYLSEWQYGYAPGVAGVGASYAPYNAPYYNGYPPPAHHQQTHYLSPPALMELHKSGEVPAAPAVPVPPVPSVPSVGFGGFC